jgi:Mg2+ and Co2+ transporter CorA
MSPSPDLNDRFDDLARRIEEIAEEVADISRDLLSDAVSSSGTERSDSVKLEQRLQKVRRALVKAEQLLTADGTSSVD